MFKNLLFFSIATTLIIILWIISTVHGNMTKSTISQDINVRTAPITPTFDKDTLNSLKDRQLVPVDFNESINIATKSSKVTPTPRKIIETTSSGQLNSRNDSGSSTSSGFRLSSP